MIFIPFEYRKVTDLLYNNSFQKDDEFDYKLCLVNDKGLLLISNESTILLGDDNLIIKENIFKLGQELADFNLKRFTLPASIIKDENNLNLIDKDKITIIFGIVRVNGAFKGSFLIFKKDNLSYIKEVFVPQFEDVKISKCQENFEDNLFFIYKEYCKKSIY
ncbi:hypothetical protein GVAV_001496 [Gurleya vavrai]